MVSALLNNSYLKYLAGVGILLGVMNYENANLEKIINARSPTHKLVIIKQPWLCPVNRISIYKLDESVMRDTPNFRQALNADKGLFTKPELLTHSFTIWALPAIIPWTCQWQLFAYDTKYSGSIKPG